MDDDTKAIMEDIRSSVAVLARTANEISEYLTWLRGARVQPIGQASPYYFVPTVDEPTDPRRPYLAGRQPRRDGDSFGTVAGPTTGGEHGSQAKDPK